ncbi:MAG: hypothetical protein V4439_00930 [Patescibacteria group bacterium]
MIENSQMNDAKFSPKSNDVVFTKGQKINVELTDGSLSERTVINVLNSQKVAAVIGLKFDIKTPIPVLILDKKIPGGALAHYHQNLDVIFAYNDTNQNVMCHEIIHSLAIKKPIPEELQKFYEKVLEEIPDITNLQPNFRQNIHEFIADAYSKEGFINNLKNHGLYEEFEKLTKYIFE